VDPEEGRSTSVVFSAKGDEHIALLPRGESKAEYTGKRPMRIRRYYDRENPDIEIEDQWMNEALMQALTKRFWQGLDPGTQKLLQGCLADISGRPGNLMLTLDCPNEEIFARLSREEKWLEIVGERIEELVGNIRTIAVFHPQKQWLFFRRLSNSQSRQSK
jgi:hypothetical protein